MDVSDNRSGARKHKDDLGDRCQKRFQDFLEEFREDGELRYIDPCTELTKMDRNALEVSFEDIEQFDQALATTIIEDYYRVYPFLCQAVSNVVKDRCDEPLKKEFFVSFIDFPQLTKIRQLRGSSVGTLTKISGQVTRTHPVHPELVSGTFTCLDCRTVMPNIEQQFKYTQPVICSNPVCSNRLKFELNVDKSVFVDFQKVKVQETQEELPRGCIPRSVDIILRAEIVETVQAGDEYFFTGTLISVPDVGVLQFPGAKAEMKTRKDRAVDAAVGDGIRGLKSLGARNLNYRVAFLASSATPGRDKFAGGDLSGDSLSPELMKKYMTEAQWNKIYEMSKDKDLFSNLMNSLFPTIHGHDQVKKGILLMLFGGVAKKTIEGTALRGDINCCIVGDPSTAKSQFLRQVADISPRSIYTSGKASSAAGLTAAVIKDDESMDFVIEAGAVLLADNGICCIDEFDKMELYDQVAIHEAMEQQTISIAKAGVRATLNARTSILAAANPVGGRYDRSKSLQRNVSLSAPIMSRFDLFFVLVDECNEVVDYAIADRILAVHTENESVVNRVYKQEEVMRYITFAKQFHPVITPDAQGLLVDYYTQLRMRDTQSNSRLTWRITVRQLESLIRLSEAMAKMECSDEVLVKHVRQAYDLLNKSIIRVEQPDISLDDDEAEPAASPVHHEGQVEEMEVNVDDPEPQETRKKMTLTFDEYQNFTNMLVVLLRDLEEKRVAEAGEDEIFEGVRRSELIEAYLEKIADQIETEDELVEKKNLIEKIIDRLMFHDQVFIPLTSGRGRGDDDPIADGDDPLLVAHPNYVTER